MRLMRWEPFREMDDLLKGFGPMLGRVPTLARPAEGGYEFMPLADVIAGRPIPFAPRWQMLPQGFWDFLAVGMGGYIGGRSLEKVAGAVTAAAERKTLPRGRR